jgi:dTDP-4-dehydrorhamnose 3,5-epimerase
MERFMNRFNVSNLPLEGLKLITRKRSNDERGYFSRLFCTEELIIAGWLKSIAQINHSYTATKGTVRGLHFQYPPHSEMKMVTCLRGEIWDVAVDVREQSPTFLKWHAEYLSASNGNSLLVPEGFAHGFQSMVDDVDVVYFCSSAYNSQAEGALNIQDPKLAITWPTIITKLSEKDREHPFIENDFTGILLDSIIKS